MSDARLVSSQRSGLEWSTDPFGFTDFPLGTRGFDNTRKIMPMRTPRL